MCDTLKNPSTSSMCNQKAVHYISISVIHVYAAKGSYTSHAHVIHVQIHVHIHVDMYRDIAIAHIVLFPGAVYHAKGA